MPQIGSYFCVQAALFGQFVAQFSARSPVSFLLLSMNHLISSSQVLVHPASTQIARQPSRLLAHGDFGADPAGQFAGWGPMSTGPAIVGGVSSPSISDVSIPPS